jgi:hypothetical protein
MPKSKKNSVNSLRRSKRRVNNEYYREYLPTYFDTKLDNFNTKSRSINWGMGLEHEVQFFHISDKKSKETHYDINKSNIIFDSQESTCFLTKNTGDKGSCCKMRKTCYHNLEDSKDIYRKYKSTVTDEEKDFLNNIPWELSGRQQKGCTNPVLLKRIPILMPEFVTENHKNRSIESLCNELLHKEKKFINIQMKNPFTKEKVKKYGEIRQLPYGTISTVKVPVRPTIQNNKYTFEDRDYTDYLGSYHVTMTLPCHDDITDEDFVELHRNFGKQVQMIEPLLIAAFFSADPRSVGDGNKKIEGSFRVMATGWGNFGGSDLRELGKGIGRYANIDSNWRKTLNFEDTKELHKCNKEVYIDEPNAVGILSSDFRTFGFDFTNKCPGKECPKVSGAEMIYPYGVELRIFDHFNSYHLLSLVRILVYIAENSRIKECKKYIYNDNAWKTTLRDIMKQGWNAKISTKYLKLIRENMGLEMNVDSDLAFDVLKVLVSELFEKHKKGLFPSLMIKNDYKEPPEIPGVNRFSWQIAFNKEHANKFNKFLTEKIPINKILSKSEFEKHFFEEYSKKLWKDDIDDVLYTFEATPHRRLKLYIKDGNIIKLKRLK